MIIWHAYLLPAGVELPLIRTSVDSATRLFGNSTPNLESLIELS